MGEEQIEKHLDELVDAWCERRCLDALAHVLRAKQIPRGPGEDAERLLAALRKVMTSAKHELTKEELATVQQLIDSLDRIVEEQ